MTLNTTRTYPLSQQTTCSSKRVEQLASFVQDRTRHSMRITKNSHQRAGSHWRTSSASLTTTEATSTVRLSSTSLYRKLRSSLSRSWIMKRRVVGRMRLGLSRRRSQRRSERLTLPVIHRRRQLAFRATISIATSTRHRLA